MQQKFERGTELWQMMADFYKLQSDFWQVEKSNEYWNDLMKRVDELLEKYADYDKIYIARMLSAFVKVQEEKYKGVTQ